MKTLLLVSEHPGSVDTIRSGTNAEEWRLVHRAEVSEAEPMLVHGLVSVCVLEFEEADAQGLWTIERVRKWASSCPLIVFVANPKPEWIEEAFVRGAANVLEKPVRARLIQEVLQRLAKAPAAAAAQPAAVLRTEVPAVPHQGQLQTSPIFQSLSTLRAFSGILTHSLDSNALIKQFLLSLRELFGLNRVIVFLSGTHASDTKVKGAAAFHAEGAIGVSQAVLQSAEMSREEGILSHLLRSGRIVRRTSPEVLADPEAAKQFALFGVEVAIPIVNRDTVIGMALLDGRITGEALSNPELEVLFHLLEQLGLGLRNITLHEQLSHNSQMMAGVLRELSSGCVVIGRDLKIQHANKTARKLFGPPDTRSREFDFNDLPSLIGSKAYQVLQTGTAVTNFRYEDNENGTVLKMNITPFQNPKDGVVESVLLTLDDLTQSEQLRKLETEAADLRLMGRMTERMVAQIRNDLTPVKLYRQMLPSRGNESDADAVASTLHQLADNGFDSIERTLHQVEFAVKDLYTSQDAALPLSTLIDESFQGAVKYATKATEKPQLKADPQDQPVTLTGNKDALKHAFTEILINAVQDNKKPRVRVHSELATNGTGPAVIIDIQDNGTGFTPESAAKATDPFYSGKPAGSGLGLTSARKIIENHGGRIEFIVPKGTQGGHVRVFLPLKGVAK